MTTIDFPLSPVAGQEFEAAGTTYVFNGTGWVIKPVDPSGQFYTKPESDVRYVNAAGDTMTGLLTMPYMPTVDGHVANKAYVDSRGGLNVDSGDLRYLKLAGGVMAGPISTLPPTDTAHATNKAYVDTADALKADKTYVDAADALKADKTYVDAQDAAISATVALKADKTYVDSQDAAVNANANNRVAKTGDAMTGQLRMNLDGDAFAVRGSVYGMIMHHNTSQFYLMVTAANDPQGGWNTLRPFILDYASGNVTMSHSVTVGANFTAQGELRTNSYAKAPTYYFGDTGYYWSWDGSNVACNGNIYGHAAMTLNGALWLNGNTIYWRGNGGMYINNDGYNYNIVGLPCIVHSNFNATGTITGAAIVGGIGYRARQGSAGTYSGSSFNIEWTGSAHLWMDQSYLGGISLISDYRAKKDVADLGSTWDKVKALRPISYTHKEFTPQAQIEYIAGRLEKGETDGPSGPLIPADDIVRWGFMAHELQETLLHSAAYGEKDSNFAVQSPNLAPVVAALTKALQEAMARIEALEAA